MISRLLKTTAFIHLLCAVSLAQESISQKELMAHLLREESSNGGAPVYPPLARQARIQGSVELDVLVDELGKVRDVHVVQGHPMLSSAALQCARGWKFRPFVMDDKAIEVEAHVTVEFKIEQPYKQRTQHFDENFRFEMNRAHAQMEIPQPPDYAQAETHANEAKELAQQAHRPLEEAQAQLLLAKIREQQQKDALKDYDEALRLVRLARSLNMVSAADPILADAYYQAGSYYFKNKRYDSAESALTEALQAWHVRTPQTPAAKAQLAIAASMSAASNMQLNHPSAATADCEMFRQTKSALHGLELDEAQERCRQIH